ncbi:ABC transporter ATP-binding protein [Ruminococcaceae bacterium OttesenSCG-928-I18]|nr:ABC transporter ATP-binding protein [Ruminococcaceae bacterium OttesenSCG-928-I18]
MNTIEVNHLSVYFNMGNQKIDNLKDFFIQKVKRNLKVQKFWALRDVSFTLHEGEALGVLGLNGSGKSTLLKTIAGVLEPSEGSVRTVGSIAPMIELGAGFDLDLTARENIYLNGAVLGYDREYMKKRFDEIIDFAELEDFVDVPVKNFSSGMTARLGFSIATMNQPDILILDEVLSVGDFKFQAKSQARTQEIIDNGATVLFVSHAATQVAELCTRALWLDRGRVVMDGPMKEVVEAYTGMPLVLTAPAATL